MLISLCCLSAPAIAECSKNELLEYVRIDEVLAEYKDSYAEAEIAYEKFRETQTLEDVTKYCKIQRKNIQLTQEWLSLDAQLGRSCPVFYSKLKGDAKVMFNTNLPVHQREVDACEANGL